ncbi:NAD-specific glutamate dehydrogenase [Rhizobium beringeri]
MAARNNPKREKQIESARKIAKATGEAHLDPEILFGRASNDDLELYTPEMLALSAVHSAKELDAWNGKAPRVSIDTIADVTPDGIAVSVLSVTDQNMPFLFESVMGEVTSTYRDLFMAVHPILIMEKGKAPAHYSADHPSDPANRVSHIQLHIAPLNSAQAADLVKRIEKVLEQVRLSGFRLEADAFQDRRSDRGACGQWRQPEKGRSRRSRRFPDLAAR